MSGEIIKADKVLNIGQRVEFYLENDDTRYTSRIEDITQDSLVVAMPVDEKEHPWTNAKHPDHSVSDWVYSHAQIYISPWSS